MNNMTDIDLAIQAHTHWMSQIRQAVLDALSGIDVNRTRADSFCEFGKWLNGPGLSADDRLTDHYLEVRRLHTEFHELAGRIVDLAAAGQVAEAYTLLYGEYITLSGRLVLAMRAWQASLLGF
ncbi:MAG: CZB domain-containing protein [Dechloromonas sp.]|jgi:hypothetical protein|nr:CZB domain-containing protein [Candidatus Dechloromonas phosphoritropha]MBP8788441.1 CZB domain-containing protein [Azonexus sp.]MBP9228875.1 CZB domain-containing protein [Azonexus sp.]